MTAPFQPPPPQSGLTAAQLAALLALVQAQAAIRQQLTDTAIAAIVGPIGQLGADVWWNDDLFRATITRGVKTAQAAQRHAARTTDAYLTRAAKEITGKTVKAAGAADVSRLRRVITPQMARALIDGGIKPGRLLLGDTHSGPGAGIDAPVKMGIPSTSFADPAAAYIRVAEAYRYKVIAEGVPEVDARNRALVRLGVVTETDVTLAVREQEKRNLGRQGAIGYRRILHPELAKSGHSCGLCVVAADRTYHVEELKPIHNRCNCEVLGVYKKADGTKLDPGIALNWSDLNAVYQAAGGTAGGQPLRRVRVVLAEHGELGPTLIDGGQHYRGPVEVAKTKADRPTQIRAQLKALREQQGITRYRAEQGLTKGQAVKWQANRIAELEKELAAVG
jgi:hypothetical protein